MPPPDSNSTPFLGIEPPPLADSAAVLLPIPFERTVSWGRGTQHGPAAVLAASEYLELYDEELHSDPSEHGLFTTPPTTPTAIDLGAALSEIEQSALPHLEAGKFVVGIGGEHAITPPLVRATSQVYGPIGVVQFDAHADLRDSYEGTPHSHACAMRRVLDLDVVTVAVGIRSLSAPEAEFRRDLKLPTIWGHELDGCHDLLALALDRMPDRIYLTFDVDYFDPSIMPATGTPEPGGGLWYPTLDLLRQVFTTKEVVAMDVVELAPITGQPASEFLVAKLIYKCCGYRLCPSPD